MPQDVQHTPAAIDPLLQEIAGYTIAYDAASPAAYNNARLCLIDAIGCAMQAFAAPECVRLLGPEVPGMLVPCGARVPGTQFELTPAKAAFDIGCLIRWLDFSDTGPAGGHPSDNLGAILATADYLARTQRAAGGTPMTMREVMSYMIKAYEIQGALWENNSFDRPGIALDPCTVMAKITSAAVITRMLGGGSNEIIASLSNAIVDGHSLFMVRKVPWAGPRKSWAAADAASRAVRLSFMTMSGEPGYPLALSAPEWGFNDICFKGNQLAVTRTLGCRDMENVLFKIAYPAQRHAQSAAECAVRLHPLVKSRVDEIDHVAVTTHATALRTITAMGPLANFAARDHNLQYIVAVALLDGDVTAASYKDKHAADPRIDALRASMVLREDEQYTRGYRDPARRSNTNAIQVFFRDGTSTPLVEIECSIGDPSRRAEGAPLLEKKFRTSIAGRFSAAQQSAIVGLLGDQARLEATAADAFMDLLVM